MSTQSVVTCSELDGRRSQCDWANLSKLQEEVAELRAKAAQTAAEMQTVHDVSAAKDSEIRALQDMIKEQLAGQVSGPRMLPLDILKSVTNNMTPKSQTKSSCK